MHPASLALRLISDNAPAAIKEGSIDKYLGRKIAVDASMSIYQFLIAVRSHGDGASSGQLTNDAGEVTSHLTGMLYRTIRMLEAGRKHFGPRAKDAPSAY